MAIFGEALQLRERSMVAGVGQGNASLGVLRVHRPQLSVNQQGNLRLRLKDPPLSLSVTDIRFYEQHPGEWRLNREVVDAVRRRIQRGAEVLLSVGLTRAWSKRDEAFHWLQVNNIHLADQPIW
jgi:hypothetical protein